MERYRYEGNLRESVANGQGKLITEDFVYEGYFDKGTFLSGRKYIRDKATENRIVTTDRVVASQNVSVSNSNEVVEITKDVLIGTGEVTGKIFVGLMKFTGQVLLGVAKELPSAYAEQKRIEAISKNAYRKGINDARRRCQGSTSC